MSKNKNWFGYLLYALILTVGLLYFRFPSDAVEEYFQARGERANPPLALSVDRIGPLIPFGLKFVQTRVSLHGLPDRLILRADRLWLRPSLWSLLGGRSEYSFRCDAYEGDMKGRIKFEKDQAPGFIDTEMALRNIHLGDYTYLSNLTGRSVEGILGGTISYKGHYNLMSTGSGGASLNLSNGRVELTQPFLTLESIDFDEMEIEMVLNEQRINVARLEFKGKQLQGTLSGTVTLRKEFTESILDLRGTIKPFAALFKTSGDIQDTVAFVKERLDGGTLSFMIEGTLGNPVIKFT